MAPFLLMPEATITDIRSLYEVNRVQNFGFSTFNLRGGPCIYKPNKLKIFPVHKEEISNRNFFRDVHICPSPSATDCVNMINQFIN